MKNATTGLYFETVRNLRLWAAEYGLHRENLETVLTLHRRGPLSQKDLASALGSAPSTISRNVDWLARRCLVVKHVTKEDGRRLEVRLTAKARSIARAVSTRLERSYVRWYFHGERT